MISSRHPKELLFAFLFVLVSFLAIGTNGSDPSESFPGVLDLAPANFDAHVDGSKHALVEFYAPCVSNSLRDLPKQAWCGHCKKMADAYKELGRRVSSDAWMNARVQVAKVDANEHKELGERFGVGGFPTILYFPRGVVPSKDTMESYRGSRTADGFHSFLQKKIEEDQSSKRLDVLDDLVQEFLTSNDRSTCLTKMMAAVEQLPEDVQNVGQTYVKIAKKTIERGDEYAKLEMERVARLLESGQVGRDKMSELLLKSSVLQAYAVETTESA